MKIKNFIKRIFQKKVVTTTNIPLISNSMLENKVAIVFGATGGIGSAITDAFIRNGCKVIAIGTNQDKLNELSKKYSTSLLKTYICDVTRVSAIKDCINSCSPLFGKIEIMVYSSGVHCADPFGNISEESWDRVININLKGMYFCCQYFADYLIKNGIRGHILTIGSASCAKPGWTPYEISKRGVESLTLGFADKLIKYGVVVNSIAPGPVATDMLNASDENLAWEGNPSGRMCSAKEVANLALFMVSNTGDMMVGNTTFISGGSGTICIDK